MPETAAVDPIVGQIIGERYRVIAPLGRGGMGAVYRVEHTMMKKELALKLLHPELGRLDEIARRFEREAEAAAKLDHPNIIHVTDFGRTADGLLFLVMELLHGHALTDLIHPTGAPSGPIEVRRALHITRQILRALEQAHGFGIVHRDLKPDNIMLIERDGERDIVKLLDFGIAKMIATEEEERGEVLTQAGVVFGTPEYLSPEQAMGEEADGRADLYSTGIVLYEMLTGRRPFEASSKVAVVSMHITQKAMPVTQAAPTAAIPRAVERVVERAMAKKRDERFANAQEFLQAVEAALESAPSSPSALRLEAGLRPITDRWERAVGLARRSPRALALIVALAALAVLVVMLVPRKRAHGDLTESLQRAEALLQRGELEPARAVLQQLESAHPATPRVRYLFGNLDYAQGERERALSEYHEAIRLDGDYRRDPVLRGNVRALLDRRGEGAAAVALLADDVGKEALPDLTACAKSCRDERVRRRAAEAAASLGGPPLTEEPKAASDDPQKVALERLRSGRSCRERKVAALEIIATGDKRYLDSLRAARERRGGFFGLSQINVCMRRELDAAIRQLEAEK